MEKDTKYLLLGAAALVGIYLFKKANALGNLVFLPLGVTFNGASPQMTIGVQNPTSTPLTLMSIVGQVLVNGSPVANVSDFVNQVIQPNAQTNILINVAPNLVGIANSALNLFEDAGDTSGSVKVSLTGTANINNAPFPISVNF